MHQEPLLEEPLRLRSGAYCRMYRGDPSAKVGVVAMHPWGPLGGNLHDPHVVTVTRFFGHAGCATARLQFRTGFSCGSAPIGDASAAAEALLRIPNIQRVLLVGYSYGSIVAMSAADAIPEALGWASIAPPLDYVWALFLFNSRAILDQTRITLPKLLVHPTRDEFCKTATFDAYTQSLPEPKLPIKIRDASHFNVARHIPAALRQWLQAHFGAADAEAFARGDFPAMHQ
ncbi:hypothetical protein CTAYLR_007246 [Chrysophaeum taylorii]|uniref:AB hydrolase-1 domain-containing protein n=1 Tax=Chrysophaeum taylorii TaxID=2483200 RepID=A0AAD7UC71_9STRA|nr:hypothetical protein CTAYLR_007246 [Chrysophaeum taylorii]